MREKLRIRATATPALVTKSNILGEIVAPIYTLPLLLCKTVQRARI